MIMCPRSCYGDRPHLDWTLDRKLLLFVLSVLRCLVEISLLIRCPCPLDTSCHPPLLHPHHPHLSQEQGSHCDRERWLSHTQQAVQHEFCEATCIRNMNNLLIVNPTFELEIRY